MVALAPPTSPPNPGGIRVLYASMVGTPNVFGTPDTVGVFLSQDQGSTWTARAATGTSSTTYGGYAFHMAVDPDSPGDGVGDIIYFGTLAQVRSTDAGATFGGLTGLHADTHTWAFAKQSGSPTIIFCGNDGGIFSPPTASTSVRSMTEGSRPASSTTSTSNPIATASVTLGALQDNGVATTAGAVSPAWQAGLGGDGFDVAHDGQIAAQAYARSNGNIFRSTNDGDSYPTGITPPFTVPEQGTYLAAVASDPSKGNVVYVSGKQNLWQSTDGGATWPNHFPIPGAANEVDVAPTNGNNVVVAVGGQVFVSTNALVAAGFTFTDITRDLPGLNVTRVAFDPTDPTAIYAVLSGFSGFPGGHVFRTTLGASTWKDISPPLDLPFNAVALDGSETPTGIYAGTDFGVLRSVDGGASWSILDDIHFPRAPVFELVFHNGELRAATFGRGVFSFVKPAGPSIALALEHGLAFGTVCQGPQYLTLTVYNVGAQGSRHQQRSAPHGIQPTSPCSPTLRHPLPPSGRRHRVHGGLLADRGGRARDRHHPDHQQRSRSTVRRYRLDRRAGHGSRRHVDCERRRFRKRLPRIVRRRAAHYKQFGHMSAFDRGHHWIRGLPGSRAFFRTQSISAPGIRSTWRCASNLRASA